MEELQGLIGRIDDLDDKAMNEARERQDQLTKPPGSLGVLEQISIRLAGITSDVFFEIKKKAVIVMAGDHGVTQEGVSAYPSAVTEQMVLNFVRGGAAVNVLSRQAGVDVVVVDMGVKAEIDDPQVVNLNVRRGTANMAQGPAMSKEEALQAIMAGASVAANLIGDGVSILATGEMGIGNTTASSAIVSVLGAMPVSEVVGAGTGIDSDAVLAKIAVIERAIALNAPDCTDPIDVIAKVGGLEIAGLAGVILEAAASRVPVVIDGFISGAAALAAAKLAPRAVNYMFASHQSVEPGHGRTMAEIGLSPVLHMDMRLGEGTGAVLTLGLIEAASRIIKEMATFAEAGVSEAEEVETVV